ncbi:MAG: hypothetical protein ACKVYV_08535, partial [Limisphaerales bacterium]
GGVIRALAARPDGSVLVGGSFTNLGGLPRAGLAKVLPAGTVDGGYNPAGESSWLDIIALAEDAQGRLLIGGNLQQFRGTPVGNLLRLTAAGAVDAAFAANASAAGIGSSTVSQVRVLADGRVLIAGGPVRRLNPDGTPDGTFSAGAGLGPASLVHFDVLADGRIALASLDWISGAARVLRLLPDGAADPAFTAGLVLDGSALGIAALTDGRLAVGGDFIRADGFVHPGLCRVQASGALDPGFRMELPSAGDLALQRFGNLFTELVALPDGGLLAGGRRWETNGVTRPALLRLVGGEAPAGPPALILAPPNPQLVEGHELLLAAAVRSADPVEFEWRRDGLPLPGEAGPSLVRPSLRLTEAGTYALVARGPQGAVTSAPVRIEVAAGPSGAGSVDTTFFAGRGPSSPGLGPVTAVKRAPDGGYFVSGGFKEFAGHRTTGLARLLPDGSVDRGYVAFRDHPATNRTVTRIVAALADGRALVKATFQRTPVQRTTALYRLRPDGTVDASYSTNQTGDVSDALVEPDGALIATGNGPALPGVPAATRLWRLQPDGTPDAGFQAFGSPAENTRSLRRQRDGRLVVLTTEGGAARVRRFHANGTPDPTLASPAGLPADADSLELLPDDRIVIAASTFFGTPRPAVIALRPDGALDTSFAPPTTNWSGARLLGVQPNGLPMLAVFGTGLADDGRLSSVVRLHPDGRMDESFVFLPVLRSAPAFEAGMIEPDGQIMAAGSFVEQQGTRREGILRINGRPDGALLLPRLVGGRLEATIRTRPGRVYSLETRGLDSSPWREVDVVTGDGSRRLLGDAPPSAGAGLYRVKIRE